MTLPRQYHSLRHHDSTVLRGDRMPELSWLVANDPSWFTNRFNNADL